MNRLLSSQHELDLTKNANRANACYPWASMLLIIVLDRTQRRSVMMGKKLLFMAIAVSLLFSGGCCRMWENWCHPQQHCYPPPNYCCPTPAAAAPGCPCPTPTYSAPPGTAVPVPSSGWARPAG